MCQCTHCIVDDKSKTPIENMPTAKISLPEELKVSEGTYM